VAIVCACELSVEAYAAAGRAVELGPKECPACARAMICWSGYWRSVRDSDRYWQKIWAPRAHCRSCRKTHVLLPSFVLLGRQDLASTIGAALEEVANGRPIDRAASSVGIARSTVRGWLRRFAGRARTLAVSFSALSVELSGEVVRPVRDDVRFALSAIRAAFSAACQSPGWFSIGCFGFVSAITGGKLLSTNTNPPLFVVGKRRFIPPVG
jgi:transposase-like protein